MKKKANKKASFPATINTRDLDGDNGIKIGDDPGAILGDGYSSDQERFVPNPCFASNVTFDLVGTPMSKAEFGHSVTQDIFEKNFKLEVEESFASGKFSQDFKGEYSRDIRKDQFTENAYFYVRLDFQAKKMHLDCYGVGEKGCLSNFGNGSYNADSDHTAFRAQCGDKYVSKIKYFAGLFATMSLIFDSAEDKKAYSAGTNLHFGSMLNVSASVKNFVYKYNKNVNVEIKVIQIGGEIQNIGTAFSGPGPYSLASCNKDTIPECEKAIVQVKDYSGTKQPKYFGNQFNTLEKAGISGYEMNLYKNIGIKMPKTIITDEITAARNQLHHWYSTFLSENDFMQHTLKTSSVFQFFDKANKIKIQTVSNNLVENLKEIQNPKTGAMVCYNEPEECLDTFNKISSKLIPIDENYINQIKNSYKLSVFTNCLKAPWYPWWQNPIKEKPCGDHEGHAIAIPKNNNGTDFEWNYYEVNKLYANNLTIMKNKDDSLSLRVNGGPNTIMKNNGYGSYNAKIDCPPDKNVLPHPFEESKDCQFLHKDYLVLEPLYDWH